MAIVSLLFFLSGATGLVYEVLWAKYLSLALGSTALAHTSVLSVFMGGVALGNAVLGRRADESTSPLRLYGLLEIGVALFGLVFPVLYAAASRAPGPWTRLAPAILLVPTFLMGGTLPALSRYAAGARGAADPAALETAVARLYFINSAGAALGALAAGFALIPGLGMNASSVLASFVNLGVGAAAVALSLLALEPPLPSPGSPTQAEGGAGPPQDQAGAAGTRVRVLLAGVFLSGFAAMAYEIAWIRLLSLVLGSSAYSFSLMLAAFIAGIAAGGWLVARRKLPRMQPYALFGLAEAAAGLSILATLPFYPRLPYLFHRLHNHFPRTPDAFYAFESSKLLFCLLLMLLPTACLGTTLPLAVSAASRGEDRVGTDVGRIFAYNTLGNVLGAAAAGLWLLPALGIKVLIETGVLMNLSVGAAVAWTGDGTRTRRAAAIAAVLTAFAACAALTPAWDKKLLSGGEFRQNPGNVFTSFDAYRRRFERESLAYYKDDRETTVTVVETEDGNLYLKVNGKTDATSSEDLSTQELMAHIPFAIRPQARSVLVVGLGSGATAGSALAHPVERLDVVEISRAVAEAAELFRRHNRGALQDPRLRLHIEDAKAFLKRPGRYDLIISEPSNPWVAGVANLFTVEFYRDAQARLNPGGLMAQWFHIYEMDDDSVRLVLRTMGSVFRRVEVWNTAVSDLLLVGSDSSLEPDFRGAAEALSRPGVAEDLRRIEIRELATLLSLHAAGDAAVRRIAGKGRVNRDLVPILEYQAPKAFFLDRYSRLLDPADGRLSPWSDKTLALARYLEARGRPLARRELRDMADFHKSISSKLDGAILAEWARRYPSDEEPGRRLREAGQQE